MLPRKKRHLLYALFLLALSVVYTTALANSKVYTFIEDVAEAIEENLPILNKKNETEASSPGTNSIRKSQLSNSLTAFMPPSIVIGADAEVGCGVDGSSVAQVFICGDYDSKPLTLQGNPSGAVWERYVPNGGCTLDLADNCPSFLVSGSGCNNTGSSWTQVATGGAYTILPADVPVSSGTEYRVRSGGVTYYIKATKSSFNYNYELKDVVCGTLGSIRITELSPAYELRIAAGSGGFGPWQDSKEFTDLTVGDYTVEVRLKNTPNACEYPYPPFTIADRTLDIEVTVTDANCPGQNGDIFVQLNGTEVPGPYTYTLIDAGTNQPIVFTPGIAPDSYTFFSVSPGTYIVKIETPECQDDFSSGTLAPTQDQDIFGNPIVIGQGLQTIVAIANLNGQSFGCPSMIGPIDIDITTTGGTPPYTYTVTGGGSGSSPSPYTDIEISQYAAPVAGTYTFTFTDANGCSPDQPLSVYIDNLPPPTIDPEPVLGTCTNGGGKIDFQVVNNPGYDLEYRVSSADPWVNYNIVNVPDGTYNDMWVRYSQGAFSCELQISDTVVVTSDASITGFAQVSADFTCSAGGGTITFNPGLTAGGTGTGYEYSIDNVTYQSGNVFSGLAPGTYTPFIRDDSDCRQAIGVPLVINDPVTPTDITFAQGNINCATGTSEVTVTVVGGALVATYEIVAPAGAVTAPQAINVFPNLILDTRHDFIVTDINGCDHAASFVTGGISTIQARIKAGGDTNVCAGFSDGFGAFIIDGFNPDTPGADYNYSISGTGLSGSSSDLEIPVTGLGAGTYTITVTDTETNCTDTADLVISGPPSPLTVTPNFTPMSCGNGNVGSLEAIKAGGFSGQEQYQLTYPDLITVIPWKNGRFFGGLNQTGTYTIEVRDAEGCIANNTFNLASLGAPTISEGTINRCFTSSSFASIEVFSTVGTGNLNDHRFRIVGQALQPLGVPGTHTFNNLVPGTYTIEVENIVTGCTATLAPITIEPELQVQLNLNSDIACGGDGSIDIAVTGGDISDLTSTSYILRKDGVPVLGHNGVQLPSNPFTYTVPFGEHGDYTIELTDNNTCTDISDPLTMIEPTNITATANATGPSCGDLNSGFVELVPIVNPGIAPFQYVFGPVGSLTDVVTAPNYPDGNAGDGILYTFSSQSIYSGLAAGTYEYMVIDARGCPTSLQTVVIAPNVNPAPDAIVAPLDATCNVNVVSGGIQITSVTDGIPEFTYIIEDAFGNEITRVTTTPATVYPLDIIDPNIIPGNYQVITLDSRGCRDIDVVSVGSAAVTIVPDNTILPPTCVPGGFIYCVDIVGGTGPFDIRLVDGSLPPFTYTSLGGTPPTPVRRHCFPNIQFGQVFTVEVVDTATGCTYQEVIEVPVGPSPVDVSLAIDNATCIPGNLVELTYTVLGSTGILDIEIRNTITGALFIAETRTETTFSYQVPEGAYSILVYDNGTTCSDGAQADAILNEPRVDIIENINSNCNADGQLTVRGSGGTPYPSSGPGSLPDGSPYEYAYVPAGTPVDVDGTLTPADPSDDFITTTTVTLPGAPAPGSDYDVWVRDFRNCAYRISAAVITEDPPLPAPTKIVNNQCDVSTPVGGFEIIVEMPGNIDTPTFTLDGVSLTPVYTPGVPTQAIFYVNSIGNYPINVTDINGCFVNDSTEIYQVLSASADFTSTPPTCTNADGEIVIMVNGGSGDYDFDLTGIDYLLNPIAPVNQTNNGIFTGIASGTYQVIVTDRQVTGALGAPCTYIVNGIVSTTPTTPDIIDTGATDITCNNANDGSITLILDPNSIIDGISEYRLYDSSNTLIASDPLIGSFTNLGPDTYRVEVETDRGCIDTETVIIANPDPFSILDPSPVVFLCSPGTNQVSSATFTVLVDPTAQGTLGDYRYRINTSDSYVSNPTFEIFDNGGIQNILIEAIDARGCPASVPITINPPSDVSGVINQVAPMSCIQGEMIDVVVSMTTPADYVIRANPNSVATFADSPLITAGTTNYAITLPAVEGDYYLEIVTGGCAYPIPVYTVVPPVDPIITITELTPETCFNARNGIISIEIANYTGNDYTYWVYDANDPGFLSDDFTSSTPVTGASGLVTGPINIGADGNPASINDLPSGNVRVVVREDDAPNCLGYSNVITVRSPNPVAPLEVFNLNQDQTVGCSDDLGIISYDAQYGWDTDPFTFTIEREGQPSGSPRTGNWIPLITNSPQQTLSGLSAGWYRITVTDIYNCTGSQEIELVPEPIVEVALNIERPLECPNGTDAILVAVDPNDMVTEGAIGGVAGEQFLYQLIKLDSNHPDPLNQDPSDPGNHEFEFGQQTSPRFEGSGGIGVIPEGYYSVLAEGPYGCLGYSPVIQVIPPAPINPQLRLVSAPACGDVGVLELKVFNFEIGATYEYRILGSLDPWVVMIDQAGTAVENIMGVVNQSYEFEVRKVGANGPCLERGTNRVTVETPLNLTIDPASPQSPPSCSSIDDGRIELLATGGTGIYEYSLYLADAAAPTVPTTIYRPAQSSANFENLPPNYYVAVVTSGDPALCRVEAPFHLEPAIAVLITPSAQNVLCYGDETGSITMTVDAAYPGLVEFAIEPNFADLVSDPANPLVYTFTDLPVKPDGSPYRVLASDEDGCPYFFDIPLTQPEQLQITDIQTTPELCIGANDGTIVFDIQGGTPFNDLMVSPTPYYEYKIEMISPVDESGTGTFVPYDGQIIQNLIGGATYEIYTQDVNLCPASDVFTINIGVDLSAEPLIQYGCEGIFPNSTASLVLDNPSLLPDLLFYLEDLNSTDPPLTEQEMIDLADTQYTWGDLPASQYQAHIFHQNGCSIIVDLGEILAYEPLTLSTPEKTAPNEITITASGGYGDYEYFFQGESQGADNVYISNQDMNVEIEVRDSMGCVITASIPFDFTGMLEIPNFFTPDGDNNNDVWFPRNREFFPNIEVKIYDRYGRVVAILNQIDSWDGTYEGNELPSGDYWYVVNQNDDRKTRYVGHFTLYR